MPKVRVNGLDHYYEECGAGLPLVFIHGAFVDARIWEPQWEYFSSRCRLLRYDLRGHGKTGASSLAHYDMMTFADDLACLLAALEIEDPVLCGLSFGGSIAQAFAVRYPERLKGLVMAGTMVAIDFTWLDKLLSKALFPEWAMLTFIRLLSIENFIRFSFWLAGGTLGKGVLGRDEETQNYLRECMRQIDSREYLKFWKTLYGFKLLPLEKISCPVLVLNGQFESQNTYRHTQALLERIPRTEARVVPAADHVMNLENPDAFNQSLEDFLRSIMT